MLFYFALKCVTIKPTNMSREIFDLQREEADRYQSLFNLLNQEHGLILTISEMDDIIIECAKIFNQRVSKKDSTIETRKKQFACIIGQLGSEYKREMLVEFYNYWTETSINGKKLRYEKEKVFDVKLRLARWHKNSKANEKLPNKIGRTTEDSIYRFIAQNSK